MVFYKMLFYLIRKWFIKKDKLGIIFLIRIVSNMINTEKNKNIPKLAQQIIANSNDKLRFGGNKKGAYRIQKTDPDLSITNIELLEILDKGNVKFIKEIPPNTHGSASGKYNTWVLLSEDKYFSVVFGCGRNAGQKYEDQILNELLQANANQSKSILYDLLLDKINISQSNIEHIIKSSAKQVKRQIKQNIQDVGEVISDINIKTKTNENIYISLKNKDGVTFANGGYFGAFVENTNPLGQCFYTPGKHELDDFIIDGLGVDKDLAINGLNNYISQIHMDSMFLEKTQTDFNKDKVKKYLAGAYGYGYWYVKQIKNQEYEVVDLSTPDKVLEKIGDVLSVEVRYPHYHYTTNRIFEQDFEESNKIKKSKQTSVWIKTTKSNYMVEIRNSHRGTNPNEVKVKIIGNNQ
jgi:hypothetical protein